MHIADLDAGNLGANVVGGGMGIAVELLLNKCIRLVRLLSALWGRRNQRRCLPRSSEYGFYLNLPVFHCINNGYGISADIENDQYPAYPRA